jgi:SAM-dependent MidA family methyltransferase
MPQNSPDEEIRSRIRQHGKITFAEFMELALFHPQGGYYTTPSAFGAGGDYYTSPAAHPAFGALIALQLQRMWEVLGRPSRFYVVEMGAGTGLLARDVAGYGCKVSQDFASSIRYMALDRYPAGQERENDIQRIVTDDVPLKGIIGCFISNELVDSLHVHRFQLEEGEAREIYVTLDANGQFTEMLDTPSTPLIAERIARLGFQPPEGFRGEVNPGIRPWMKQVSEALHQGFVITIDYGYEDTKLYSPQRAMGTLQTYYRHTEGSSPYHRIGRQDITAHVDFSAVMEEGAYMGLRPLALMTQADFLRGLGFDKMLRQLRAINLGPRERKANVMAMRDLVKPDGLGRFKVLIQEKNTGTSDFGKLTASDEIPEPPLLGPGHMRLLEGRYPQQEWDFGELWPFREQER